MNSKHKNYLKNKKGVHIIDRKSIHSDKHLGSNFSYLTGFISTTDIINIYGSIVPSILHEVQKPVIELHKIKNMKKNYVTSLRRITPLRHWVW